MKVSLNWLRQWVDVADTPSGIADRMTMAGLETAAVEAFGEGFDKIIIGRILKIAPHPDAERLSLCEVAVGGETPLSIICGAKNIFEGAVVPVSMIGALLPNGIKIKKSKIRGVASEGMICSEEELGLAEHSAGIMLLPEDLTLGASFFDTLGLRDTVFDFEITPNRGDCLSILGIAREVSALYKLPLKDRAVEILEEGGPVADAIRIDIENTVDCPRYCARLVRDVKIGPSPLWLREKLIKSGFRAINNIVDITNYVLLELGQPLHAFDFDLLRNRQLVVRSAGKGEVFTTLDEKERELSENDLLICDGTGPVAIAGVMGGLNSEVTSHTTNVLIESAYFRPAAIRATAKRLGLPTEASFRFEREVDPEGLIRAADLAASLMAQLAGGKVAPGVMDENFLEGESREIELKTEKAASRLGISISDDEITDCMRRLFAEVKESRPGTLIIRPPSFRRDLTRPVDLIEEVGRLIGFSEIPVTLPVCDMDYHPVSTLLKTEDSVRNFLVDAGYFEVINYSFISEKWFDDLLIPENDVLRNVVRLLNPISEDMAVLRTFLLPSLLENARNNFNYKIQDIKIFEVRRVYSSKERAPLPEERHHVAGLMMGNNPFVYGFRPQPFDFLDIKGDVEGICELLAVSEMRFTRSEFVPSYFHPGVCAEIRVKDGVAGVFGKLNPVIVNSLKLPENIYYFELDLEILNHYAAPLRDIEEISKFPEIERDLAVVVDINSPVDEILEKIYRFRNKYLKEVELFDIYEGKEIPEGKKSVAFRLTYQAAKKTLRDKDVDKIHRQLASYLLKEGDIELR